jgi:hypothetical protein
MQYKPRKCVLTLSVNEDSKRRIRNFLEENKDLITLPFNEDFHSTLYYSTNNPIFERREMINEIESKLPLTIDPVSYFFDSFGRSDHLVLRYENSDVIYLRNKIIEESLKQSIGREYPGLNKKEDALRQVYRKQSRYMDDKLFNFRPHITLSRNIFRPIEDLPLFLEPITFETYSWQT